MRVRCGGQSSGPEAHWHEVTPTGLVLILDAVREGDLLRVTSDGVSVDCYRLAFTVERVASTVVRYPSRRIGFDGVAYAV